MSARTLPSKTTLLARGLSKRCPICGRGRLFRRWFVMAERCPRCGFKLEQGEGAFLGSMALNYGVGGAVFMVFLGIWLALTLPDVRAAPLVVAGVTVMTLTLLAFYPFSKTLWAAIDVMLHDPADLDLGEPVRR